MRKCFGTLAAALVLLVAALPERAAAERVSRSELECLALNVYWEARSESDKHQQAIAHVTLNRLADPRFPKTICGIVHQSTDGRKRGCQFSWWCDRKSNLPKDGKAWQEALGNAKYALAHRAADPTHGALFYHHKALHPRWAAKRQRTVRIESHIFYR